MQDSSKRILLTGSSGFFGGHVRKALSAHSPLCPTRGELDLLDFSALNHYLAERCVTHVIHTAGYVGGIGLNLANPGRMATDNLRMGLNVLEAASRRGAHVVVISTICVYPEHAPVPIREESIYAGYPAPATAAYGLAKRELLSVADALASEKKLTYGYLIPTNLYGPGDHFDEAKSHVVPALIRRALEAKNKGDAELVVWGDGSASRDLLYVEDAAKAVVMNLERGFGQPINLGSGVEVSVKEMAEKICAIVGFQGKLKWDTSKPTGAPRRMLDATRAREHLGFAASTPLDTGLERTIAWYRAQSNTANRSE